MGVMKHGRGETRIFLSKDLKMTDDTDIEVETVLERFCMKHGITDAEAIDNVRFSLTYLKATGVDISKNYPDEN
jgi:hypothetical protein